MERLPVEVLEIIFQKLPQSIEGVATLLSLRTVEKYVGNIAIGNPAWEGQLARWQHAEPTLLRGQHTAYEFYVRRAKNDRTASIKITALIDTTGNRLPQMQDITTDGLNILDRLIQLSKIDATDDEENYLATRYWAIKSIETVSRRHAITVWTKMAQGGYEDQAEAFEEGALAFGLFRGQTVGQVCHSPCSLELPLTCDGADETASRREITSGPSGRSVSRDVSAATAPVDRWTCL